MKYLSTSLSVCFTLALTIFDHTRRPLHTIIYSSWQLQTILEGLRVMFLFVEKAAWSMTSHGTAVLDNPYTLETYHLTQQQFCISPKQWEGREIQASNSHVWRRIGAIMSPWRSVALEAWRLFLWSWMATVSIWSRLRRVMQAWYQLRTYSRSGDVSKWQSLFTRATCMHLKYPWKSGTSWPIIFEHKWS